MNTKVFLGRGESHTTQTPQSTQHEVWPWTLLFNKIPHTAVNSVAGGHCHSLSKNHTYTCQVWNLLFDRQCIVQTNFGRSLWIDGARCVPSTPPEGVAAFREADRVIAALGKNVCVSPWMSCLTVNVKGEDELRRQDRGPETQADLWWRRGHTFSWKATWVLYPRFIRSFFPAWALSLWGILKDSHSYLWAQNLVPGPFQWCSCLRASLAWGPGPCVRLTCLPGSSLFPELDLSKPDDKISLQFHSLFALIEWQFERKWLVKEVDILYPSTVKPIL